MVQAQQGWQRPSVPRPGGRPSRPRRSWASASRCRRSRQKLGRRTVVLMRLRCRGPIPSAGRAGGISSAVKPSARISSVDDSSRCATRAAALTAGGATVSPADRRRQPRTGGRRPLVDDGRPRNLAFSACAQATRGTCGSATSSSSARSSSTDGPHRRRRTPARCRTRRRPPASRAGGAARPTRRRKAPEVGAGVVRVDAGQREDSQHQDPTGMSDAQTLANAVSGERNYRTCVRITQSNRCSSARSASFGRSRTERRPNSSLADRRHLLTLTVGPRIPGRAT